MTVVISLLLYKLASLIVGTLLAYMGYCLFLAGIFNGGGDLDASMADNRIVLKKASPGIFFALFGTVIITVTLFRGLQLD
jgi:hypothetical protein